MQKVFGSQRVRAPHQHQLRQTNIANCKQRFLICKYFASPDNGQHSYHAVMIDYLLTRANWHVGCINKDMNIWIANKPRLFVMCMTIGLTGCMTVPNFETGDGCWRVGISEDSTGRMGDLSRTLIIRTSTPENLCSRDDVWGCYIQSTNTIILSKSAGKIDLWHEQCHALLGPKHNNCTGYTYGDNKAWCERQKTTPYQPTTGLVTGYLNTQSQTFKKIDTWRYQGNATAIYDRSER